MLLFGFVFVRPISDTQLLNILLSSFLLILPCDFQQRDCVLAFVTQLVLALMTGYADVVLFIYNATGLSRERKKKFTGHGGRHFDCVF